MLVGDPSFLFGMEQEPHVSLARQGQTRWQIVVPSPQSAGAAWAVAELQKYLRQMTGAEFTLGTDDPAQTACVVGLRRDLSAADRAALPPPSKGYDGYAIAVCVAASDGQSPAKPERIILGGENGRGVIYGVYDLLERCGCRWFYPEANPSDPEVVPRLPTLEIAAGAWAVASPMKYRICGGDSWTYAVDVPAAEKQLDWAMKNRYNAMSWGCANKPSLIEQYAVLSGRGKKGEGSSRSSLLGELEKREMLLHGPGHSFDHFLRAEDYFQDHPEWFGMRDGKRVPQNFFGAQFCWTNAEARKTFTGNVEAFVKTCPQIHILCIGPFDGGPCCQCPECQKQGAGNALMVLMKEVIERLKRSAPQVEVETLGGYPPADTPPDGVAVSPRQRIIWAHWGRYLGIGYDDDRYDRRANLEAWRRAAPGGLTVCQYYSDNFAGPWILPPCALAIRGDRKYLLEKGIDSVYMLMWPPGCWWNQGLNGYLAGQCFYNVSLDPFSLIHDYALRYYGPQAGPLIGAYDEQWAREIDLAYRVRGGSRPQDRAMLAQQRKTWIDPAVEAVRTNPLLADRVGRVEKLHDLAERLTAIHRRREQIQHLRSQGKFPQAEKQLREARTLTDDTIQFLYTLADLHQGLIDRQEVESFLKSAITNWLDEESRAIVDGKRTK
ncbi:MAG: DUF4838 domain-containing protein [Pirellulales bacterium]|nr:DUF4838 domain-containing protein [Pirellulales bacterium]